MLRLSFFFFILSIIAGLFGYTGISESSADIAKFIFFVFATLFVISLVIGLIGVTILKDRIK